MRAGAPGPLPAELAGRPTLEVDATAHARHFRRPVSPFHIYKPQQNSVMSIGNRVTGAGVGVLMYGAAIAYAFGGYAPAAGAACLASLGGLPLPLLVAGKALLAFPIVYHTLNGVRHLVWDAGRGLSLGLLEQTGWIVLGASVVGTLALAML